MVVEKAKTDIYDFETCVRKEERESKTVGTVTTFDSKSNLEDLRRQPSDVGPSAQYWR